MITNNEMGMNGRFGNQLFQYASLYGIANKNGYEYGIPFARKSDNESFHLCLPDCFENLGAKDSSHVMFKHYLRDVNWVFNPNYFNIPDETDLWGYFQSEKYFSHCKQDIRNQFQFNEQIKNKADGYFKNGSDIVSLHIRLGDYVQIQDHHPVCSVDYYNRALERIPQGMQLCIFTDDVNMAKERFKDNLKFNEPLYVDSGDKFVDMCLMTRCSRHIIANSSFSWWGAWLANSKQVIAPEQWFGIASVLRGRHHDIYCDTWEII